MTSIAVRLQRQKELRVQMTVLMQEVNGMLDLITSKKRSLAVDEAHLSALRRKADSCRIELEKLGELDKK